MHGHILWKPRVKNYYLCVLDTQRLLGVKLWGHGKVLGGQAILRLHDNLGTLPVSSGPSHTDSFPSSGHRELNIWRAANLINFKQGEHSGRNNGPKFQTS